MILSLTGTLLLSILLTFAMIKLAVRLNIVDRPDSFLKPHARTTPYMGESACFFCLYFLYNRYSFCHSVDHSFDTGTV